ncbi:MAG: hydantoinase B/oxoprolinase family protein, partial [Planctomycetota bacterium]|nr:hydantoinase B/oxoprolinase family protein [Planctomycetota bacterium]
MDPLRVEVFHHLFAAAAEEMGVALQRSAFSVNIKERLDFSCAIFGGDGRAVAQAAHLPVHLGATPLSVEAVIAT